MRIKIYTPKREPFTRLVKETHNAIKDSVKKYMLVALREARLNVTGGGAAKDRLNVRSGDLRRSISINVQDEGKVTRGTIGSNVVYARIHELGGTIKPITKRYLTIPFPGTKTPAGVGRGSARDYSNTFFKKSKAGNLILFQKNGKSIVPLFLLRDKPVQIPARPYLMPAMEKIKPMLMREIGERIAKEVI